LRLLNTYLRKSLSAAGGWQQLGALLLAAMLVGSVVPAGAAETYRGSDPDSYECSSDYQILNRFSAPPGVSVALSTKYSDVKFTLEDNVISVKDASNSKDLAYVIVGDKTKYCAFKDVEILKERTEPTFKDPQFHRQECNIDFHGFRTRIVIDTELPVRAFSLHGPPEFDKMDHIVDVNVYRAQDWRKRKSAEGCQELSGNPEGVFFWIGVLGSRTVNKSAVNLREVTPYIIRNGDTYSLYGRQALKKAGPGVPQPK
jgi:hypothetical protein